MKRFTYLMLVVTFCTMLITPSIHAAEKSELQIADNIKSAILLERDTGEVIFAKDEHKQLPPASMTKIMTLLLTMESIERGELTYDELVTVSERAASMGGSQVFLAAGEQMTVDDLIKAIAIASGNDASVAIAERIAGSEESFVALMNDKVKELQLENTHFENTSGLPAKNHYSSAYDMAVMSKELLKHEKITDYTKIYEDYLRKGEENEFWLVNTNKLIRFYPYVDGLKTGYTSEAKYCLAATAKQGDMRVVSVIMGADTVKQRNAVTMQLIDYSFAQYDVEKLYDKGEKVGKISHLQSENQTYDVVTSEQISVLHKKGKQESALIAPEVLIEKVGKLPIKQGDKVGELNLMKDGKPIHQSALIVAENIEEASFLSLFKRSIQNIVKFEPF